jgi:hypothetical protein
VSSCQGSAARAWPTCCGAYKGDNCLGRGRLLADTTARCWGEGGKIVWLSGGLGRDSYMYDDMSATTTVQCPPTGRAFHVTTVLAHEPCWLLAVKRRGAWVVPKPCK